MKDTSLVISTISPLSSRMASLVSSLFVLLLYFCFVGLLPFGPRLPFELKETGQGDVLQRILYLAVAIGIYLVMLHRREWSFVRVIGLPILLTLGWAVSSTIWSSVPEITFRRAFFLVLLVTSVFISTTLLGPQRIFNILYYTLLALITASLIAGPIIPNAIHHEELRGAKELTGLWRGVFFHKNIAGAAAAFLFLLSAQQLIYGRIIKRSSHLWLGLLVSIPMLGLAYSKTSLSLIIPSMAISGMMYYFIAHRNTLYSVLATLGIVTTVIIVVFLGYYFDFLGVLNDPKAFTGRAELWVTLMKMVPDAPFLGYGYGALHETGENSPLLDYGTGWVLKASHSHNGFLQVTVEQGFIGLLLVMYSFILLPLLRVIYSSDIPKEYLSPLLSLMTFFVLNNFTESSIMLKDVCQWVVYLVTVSICYYYEFKTLPTEGVARGNI